MSQYCSKNFLPVVVKKLKTLVNLEGHSINSQFCECLIRLLQKANQSQKVRAPDIRNF